jgi:uncharacterized heparinase superfamily protein
MGDKSGYYDKLVVICRRIILELTDAHLHGLFTRRKCDSTQNKKEKAKSAAKNVHMTCQAATLKIEESLLVLKTPEEQYWFQHYAVKRGQRFERSQSW